MIFTNFSLYEGRSKEGVLVVVDVQESFSEFFDDAYVNSVFELCESFDDVYQVWDSEKQDGPTYRFPNQSMVFEKEYKFSLVAEYVDKLFLEPVATEIRSMVGNDWTHFSGLTRGQHWITKSGELLVYVGGKHKWFVCPTNLLSALVDLAQSGRGITLVGGAHGECLDDLHVTAAAVGCSVTLNLRYAYSATACPVSQVE